jgi:hypothetical protein
VSPVSHDGNHDIQSFPYFIYKSLRGYLKRERRKDMLLRRNIGGSSKGKATPPPVSWRRNHMVTIMIHWEDKEVSPMETKNEAYRSADSLSSK